MGILLGSIFSFGMQYWNKKVTPDECCKIETQFVEFENIRQPKRPATIKEIAIDCANGERYFIDGVSIDAELRRNIADLVCGEDITLFIHPNSNTVVELSTNSGIVLPFSETIDKLGGEATGFLFLGLFMYFCALVGLYYVVWHCTEKLKRRTR
jgi:hypothetical protein